ncbi:MAG: hypothetical protein HYW49_10190 [Deltaproteobacteria bacterium]|nr:hypothetical protein [Deltaproteobacteria bacterium]
MIRLARIFGLLLPAAIPALALFAALQASAQESPDSKFPLNYKVLGRGLENKKSGSILQLACVDESTLGEYGEPGCGKLQFVVAKPGEQPVRIGHAVTAQQIVDAKSAATAFVEDLQQKLKTARKSKTYQSRYDSWVANEIFGNPDVGGAALIIFGTWYGAAFTTGAIASGLLVASIPTVILAIPELISAIPFFVARAREKRVLRFTHGYFARTVEDLVSRARPAWQVNPSKVKPDAFNEILIMLTDDDRDLPRELPKSKYFAVDPIVNKLTIDLSALDPGKYDVKGMEWALKQAMRRKCTYLPEENPPRSSKGRTLTLRLHKDGYLERSVMTSETIKFSRVIPNRHRRGHVIGLEKMRPKAVMRKIWTFAQDTIDDVCQ